MPSPHDLPSLLLSLFSDSELRRLVRWGPNGRDLEARLPGRGVPPADLAAAVADLYEREGLIAELPGLLLHERPRRADDIHVVFERIAGQQHAATHPVSGGQADGPDPVPQVSGTLARSVTGMAWDLFLVHASADKPAARRVFDVVAPTVRTFLDEKLPAGTRWDATINRALHEAAVIAVLSSRSTWERAFFLGAEVQSAIGLTRATHAWIRVVPVHLDGLPGADHPQLYGLNLLQGIAVSDTVPIEEAARRLERVVWQVQPLHRLASLLQHVFPESEGLARWIATVPVVDPLVDPPFRVDPRLQPPEPWRQAARQLYEKGRTDPSDPVLFDQLRAVDSRYADQVNLVQQAFGGVRAP